MTTERPQTQTMLGLSPTQYQYHATRTCQIAIAIWLIAGFVRNAWLGRLLSISSAGIVMPGLFIASLLAMVGFIPYLFFVQLVDKYEARGERGRPAALCAVGLAWWILFVLIAPAWSSLRLADAIHSLMQNLAAN